VSTSASPNRQRPFVPTDLALVAALGLWVAVAAAWGFDLGAGQMALGLAAVLFAPGYAAVGVLFPAGKESGDAPGSRGVTAPERLVLAVGVSVGLVPLFALVLDFSLWPIDAPLLVGVTGVATAGLAAAAVVRRARLSPSERFDPSLFGFARSLPVRAARLRARSPLALVLLVGLCLAAGGIGFAALDAERGERFTAFYLLSEDPETGDEVAGGFPDELGPEEPVTVGISNEEGERVAYTVVVVLESVDESGDVDERETLDQFVSVLEDGETVHESHTVSPELTGEELRVAYLLYTGPAPETPDTDNAYRYVHVWTDVPETQ